MSLTVPEPTATGTAPDAPMASRTSSIHLYSAWNISPPGHITWREHSIPAAANRLSTLAPATSRVRGSSTTIALRASGKSSPNIFADASTAPGPITQAFVSVACLRASSTSVMACQPCRTFQLRSRAACLCMRRDQRSSSRRKARTRNRLRRCRLSPCRCRACRRPQRSPLA